MEKICHISTFSQKSGVGIYGLNLVKHLPKDIIVFDWPYKTRLSRLFGPIHSFFKLKQLCREFDIIHVQYHLGEFGPLFLPVLSLLKSKARIVLTLHEMHQFRPWAVKFHNKFYSCADRLIVHSKLHKNFLPDKLKTKAKFIFMGIKHVPEGIVKSDRTELLMPGFINHWKGHDIAIKAVPQDAHLTIMGQANDKTYADKIRMMCGDKPWITFKEGFVSDKEYDWAFREADVILLPYRRITMSAVLADAIAYHKPVLASDIPLFREHLQGICPLAKEDEFSEKLSNLIKDKSLRESITERFKEMSKLYSFKSLARRMMDEYKCLLQGNEYLKNRNL